MKNPHVEHGLPSDVLVDNDFGPRGPSYQRFAVWERPKGVSTCLRDRSNSSTASSMSSSEVTDATAFSSCEPSTTSASAPALSPPSAASTVCTSSETLSADSTGSVLRNPSSIRGSSGSVPIESVTAKSVGSRRSFHGIHSGGRNALSVGTSDDSLTVQWSNSASRYNVTDHCHPSYPRMQVSKRKSVTLSPKSMASTKSPTWPSSSATSMATAWAIALGSIVVSDMNYSCTSKLSATARISVASFLLSAGDG